MKRLYLVLVHKMNNANKFFASVEYYDIDDNLSNIERDYAERDSHVIRATFCESEQKAISLANDMNEAYRGNDKYAYAEQ